MTNKKKQKTKSKSRVPERVKSTPLDNTLDKYNINAAQELFCQYYTSPTEFYGSGVHSYIAAYGLDPHNPSNYNTAKSAASALLTRPNILERIDSLLSERGFNDANADKQLLFLMQQNADFNSKLGALREYNKLKQRIAHKIDHNVNVPIEGIRVIRVDPDKVRESRRRLVDKNKEDANRERDASQGDVSQ
jgi:hypothetical protein